MCEEVCVRETAEGKPVEIGRLQRYATDTLMEMGGHPFSRAEATGKTVAVVGAGPAGLSAAHRLAMVMVVLAVLVWCLGWWLNSRLANSPAAKTRAVQLLVPATFGITVLVVWELLVRGLAVSLVILPAPSVIAVRFASSIPILWADFAQTILKGALGGYLIGCGAAFLTATLVDRSDFLRRGLLPVGNFIAALPIVGTAPILVMWFGFDWHSKAAVVVVMVFFPMLVNTVAGLRETSAMPPNTA